MKDILVNQLNSLGFTVYEAKAYLALLKQNPASGYEVAQESGVPRSVIYDVLRKLEKGGIAAVAQEKPKKYIPLPPDQLVSILNNQFLSNLESLESSLKSYTDNKAGGSLWNITGYQVILQKAKEMIEKAEKSIYLSGWNSEIDEMTDELEAAKERGVSVIIFSFNELKISGAKIYTYNIPAEELERNWNHKLVLVVDKRELVMGESDLRFTPSGAWTDNPAIVSIALNYIILDITLYGQRKKTDVSHSVTEMMNGHLNGLEKLLPNV
jgi:HTH-type transcriptional regulator, sugar sensing transcriptional regulator